MFSLTLFHHPLSVCSMKARLALEEKGLAWSGQVIDIIHKQEQLEPWYIDLNPSGVVPTLQFHNGKTRVVTDSVNIIRFVASLSEGVSLLPQKENEEQAMEALIDMADAIDLQVLSYARHPSMEKSEKILDARIQKSLDLATKHPALKAHYQSSADRSLRNKQFRVDPGHIERIEKAVFASLSEMESRLDGSRFLLGDSYTLADVIWTVVLSRLELLGYGHWLAGKEFTAVFDYYQRVKSRKSFALAQIQNQWWEK